MHQDRGEIVTDDGNSCVPLNRCAVCLLNLGNRDWRTEERALNKQHRDALRRLVGSIASRHTTVRSLLNSKFSAHPVALYYIT